MPLEDKNLVSNHVDQCKDCANLLRDYQKVWGMLGEMEEISPKADYLETFWKNLKK